jgi:multidrug resistance efflux pump
MKFAQLRSDGRLSVTILACAAVLLAAGCGRQQPIQAKQDAGPVNVKVAPVRTREIQRVIESVGTLYPYDEAVISAEIEGRVTAVKVDLGDRVQQGEPLVLIADEEQKYLVQQTEAQLRMALERLGLTSEKERVKDVRETPDVRRAQADLFEAEQRFKRVRSLVDQGIGSRQDLDQAQGRFKAAQAEYDQAINQTRNLMQEAERSRASLDLQRKKLRDTTVYAPFTGAVKDRQVATGTYVRPNSPLLTLVKVDPIRLRVEIPERMAPWVRNGQVVDVLLEAFGERKFHGKVWRSQARLVCKGETRHRPSRNDTRCSGARDQLCSGF